jgi:hypothetical protein
MYVCQWHLDVPFGRQGEALQVIRDWGREKVASSGFRKATGLRVMVGHVGLSASHIVDEYCFDTLAEFETALAEMGAERFRRHAQRLAPLIVPGSQRWTILKVVEPATGRPS